MFKSVNKINAFIVTFIHFKKRSNKISTVMIICNDHKAAKAKSIRCDNLGAGKASDERW